MNCRTYFDADVEMFDALEGHELHLRNLDPHIYWVTPKRYRITIEDIPAPPKTLTYKGELRVAQGSVIFAGYIPDFKNGEYEVTLKPVPKIKRNCPHCGGEARVSPDTLLNVTSYRVECIECGCAGSLESTPEEAIASWDRRV